MSMEISIAPMLAETSMTAVSSSSGEGSSLTPEGYGSGVEETPATEVRECRRDKLALVGVRSLQRSSAGAAAILATIAV